MSEEPTDKLIDECCDRFEGELRTGKFPDIAAYLCQIAAPHRALLMRELLVLELEIVGPQQFSKNAERYIERFPEFGDLISECLAVPDGEQNQSHRFRSKPNESPGNEQASVTIPQEESAGRAGSRQASTATRMGNYKLLQVIGEGGMGSVWMAEQEQPVRRRVALKIIKAGLDSREVIARFEAERQALAMMDHPNIARILDAGTTEQGQPYFAMELVKGVPLTEYCDAHKLDLTHRLRLFTKVCDAVQHAHQKGIIHRDLKPSNILVAEYNGQPVPKVIDFGLAKALEATQKLTDKSLFTEFGQVLGTLKYMSPEQAGLDSLDIDTRSDIYALGVILYELLTGGTPLDSDSFKGQALLKVLELIREQESPRPSSRLATTKKEVLAAVTEKRRTDAKRLGTILLGDLDWIVMKALDKDRNRRYESANGFSQDIQHYLNSEPISARPPSLGYKAGKFVRKHQGLVTAASLILAAIFLGLAGTIWFALDANTAREIAIDRQRDAEAALDTAEREKTRADKEAELAKIAQQNAEDAKRKETERAQQLQLVTEFQAEQLASIDAGVMGLQIRDSLLQEFGSDQPTQFLDGTINFTDIGLKALQENFFKPAMSAIDSQFADSPGIRSRLLHVTGETMINIGLHDTAIGSLTSALDLREQEYGQLSVESIESRRALCSAFRIKGDLSSARREIEPLENLLDKQTDLPSAAVAAALAEVGELLFSEGKPLDAESYFSKSLAMFRETLGDSNPDTINAMQNFGLLKLEQGDATTAEAMMRESVANAELTLGNLDGQTLNIRNNLGKVLIQVGKLEEAELVFKEALSDSRTVLGEVHYVTLNSLNGFGMVKQYQGQFEEAEVQLLDCVKAFRERFGSDHLETLNAINNLAMLYWNQGKFDQAGKMFSESLAIATAVSGEDHLMTLNLKNNMGFVFMNQKQFNKAEPYFLEVLEARKRVLGADNHFTLISINNLGFLYHNWGRMDAAKLGLAKQYHEEALALRLELLGEDHRDTLASMNNVAILLQDLKELPKAAPLLREIMEKSIEILGPENPQTLAAIRNCALIEEDLGNDDEAEKLYRSALKGRRKVLGNGHPDTIESIKNLVALLSRDQDLSEALQLGNQLCDLTVETLGPTDQRTQLAILKLAEIQIVAGEIESARTLLTKHEEHLRPALKDSGTNFVLFESMLTLVSSTKGTQVDDSIVEKRFLDSLAALKAASDTMNIQSAFRVLKKLYESAVTQEIIQSSSSLTHELERVDAELRNNN